MNKKQILFDLINEKKVDGCTVLGIPTVELQECMVKGKDVMSFFKQKGRRFRTYLYKCIYISSKQKHLRYKHF